MIKKIRTAYSKLPPAISLVVSYLLYSLVGTTALLFPICYKTELEFIDNFFTAISAVSTTGLTTVDIKTTYTFLGQLIILFLIQIGAIGYMTFCSFVILTSTNTLPFHKEKIVATMFAFPKDFSAREFL